MLEAYQHPQSAFPHLIGISRSITYPSIPIPDLQRRNRHVHRAAELNDTTPPQARRHYSLPLRLRPTEHHPPHSALPRGPLAIRGRRVLPNLRCLRRVAYFHLKCEETSNIKNTFQTLSGPLLVEPLPNLSTARENNPASLSTSQHQTSGLQWLLHSNPTSR